MASCFCRFRLGFAQQDATSTIADTHAGASTHASEREAAAAGTTCVNLPPCVRSRIKDAYVEEK